jgi:hypothetical protein
VSDKSGVKQPDIKMTPIVKADVKVLVGAMGLPSSNNRTGMVL